MAGDWIPYSRDLPDKPEVLAIARATGRSVEDVVGTLLRFWAWADAQSATGELCPVSVPDLSQVCPRADDAFWNALARVGWLRSLSDNISIPNFDHWMGQSAKRRLQEARRKRKYRQDRTPNVPHGTGHSRDKVGTKTGPQESTGEKSKEGITSPLPPSLDNDAFRDAWERWQQHRREIRHALKPSTAAAQLKKLAGWGLERALAAIEHSITQGYQGLLEPSPDRKPAPGQPGFHDGLKAFMELPLDPK